MLNFVVIWSVFITNLFNIAMEYVKSKMEKRIFKNTQEKIEKI